MNLFECISKIPVILEILDRLTQAMEDLVDLGITYRPALESAKKLAEIELMRKELSPSIVMVTIDSWSGKLVHRIFTRTEFRKYWGERYTQAMDDFLNTYRVGTVAYMDGAFVMMAEIDARQSNVKLYHVMEKADDS